MKKERVIELARQAGLSEQVNQWDWAAVDYDLVRLVRLVEQETLERAALELDKKSLDISFLMPGAVECAKIVRALKPSNNA